MRSLPRLNPRQRYKTLVRLRRLRSSLHPKLIERKSTAVSISPNFGAEPVQVAETAIRFSDHVAHSHNTSLTNGAAHHGKQIVRRD